MILAIKLGDDPHFAQFQKKYSTKTSNRELPLNHNRFPDQVQRIITGEAVWEVYQ